jgi:HAE1 family hydrophobic/amphiphilic exporter-1
MNLPKFSVRRPIFTTMVTLIVIIIGSVSLTRLRIDLLPNIELPTLSVRTNYEGASPEVMERLVTQILEEIIATVPGIEGITSQSSEGNSRIQVSFAWGTNIDTAASDVLSKIQDEINELPDDITGPRVRKFDIGSYPVVILGISSDLDPIELTQLIEDQLRYRFARVPGVAQVDVWGGFTSEVRVELDPDRINALGLPLDQILQAIRDANLDVPTGKIEEGRFEVSLRAPAQFSSLEEIRNTVIAEKNGATVFLNQIAVVKDTYEKKNRIIRVNGEPGIRVAIRKQADANTVDVAKRILEEIDAANRAFPQVKIVPVINQGNFIERSIANVVRSVFYGGGLAVVVLLFFLRNIRSTLVITLAIPISIIATFNLLYFGGFTLNLMTLGGLALGVGMMVDNSIVVLENIYRHRNENDESIEESAVQGTVEVGPAIFASTITTLVIFLPLVFVRGVAGVLFQELAYVIVFSLICSLLVALSLMPMLAAKLMRSSARGVRNRPTWFKMLFAWSESLSQSLNNGYRDLLRNALKRPWLIVFSAAVTLGLSFLLLPLIGTEFLPPSDEGQVRITGKMEIGTRLELVNQQSLLMEKIVKDNVPEALSSVVSVGSTGWRANAISRSQMNLSLVPAAQRQRANTEIANDLRKRLDGKIAGMQIQTRAPQGQFLLERLLGGDEGLTVEIRGFDLHKLEALAGQVEVAISDIPGITDVEPSNLAGIPQHKIIIDRDKIADMGLSIKDVSKVIETAIAGAKAGEFQSLGNSYRIFVQLKDAEKRSLDEILNLTLATSSGDLVTLRNLITTEVGLGPIVIDRKDQQRLVTVQANVAGRDFGSVAADVQTRLMQIATPVGYDLVVSGKFEEQQKAFRELIIALLLALVLVFMVLACLYESLRDPLVVMVSVPVSAVGVLLILFLTNTTLNLQSYIGCIMLGGIVVQNAILLVDQASQLMQDGMVATEAVAEAGRRRLRPILMTSLTTILALLPLALGIGEGADAQAPLARAVIGGLSGSTLISLILIPAVYSLFHRQGKRVSP